MRGTPTRRIGLVPLGRETAARQFGFLLVPNFTLIGLGSAVDPLRVANMVAERTLYEFVTITMDGEPVASSDGVRVLPDFAIAETPRLDTLFVVGPNPIQKSGIGPILQWLRKLAGDRVAIGGIDTGSYFMARAGLLDGYRCTIHWEDMDALLDRFPRLVLSPKLFESDRDRWSCSGGIAALDMMIHLIGLGPGGRKIAAAVSELLISEHRGPEECQRIPLRSVIGPGNPKLLEAVTIMESNLEDPLSIRELALHVGVSLRQFERMFHDRLQSTPKSYYLELRLWRARQLLTRGNKPIADIALACGFISLAHFTNRYSTRFGISPGAERRRVANDDTFAKSPATMSADIAPSHELDATSGRGTPGLASKRWPTKP